MSRNTFRFGSINNNDLLAVCAIPTISNHVPTGQQGVALPLTRGTPDPSSVNTSRLLEAPKTQEVFKRSRYPSRTYRNAVAKIANPGVDDWVQIPAPVRQDRARCVIDHAPQIRAPPTIENQTEEAQMRQNLAQKLATERRREQSDPCGHRWCVEQGLQCTHTSGSCHRLRKERALRDNIPENCVPRPVLVSVSVSVPETEQLQLFVKGPWKGSKSIRKCFREIKCVEQNTQQRFQTFDATGT